MTKRSAKELVLRPVSSRAARKCIERYHYSGTSVQNSQVHLGVFLDEVLKGALQFGPPLDRRRVLPIVEGTRWEQMCELNRMALAPELPRNSESRSLGVAMRMLRKHAPQLKWVLSYSDATQCGDGTIYRASGFVLTDIKPNKTLWRGPNGDVISDATVNIQMADQMGGGKKAAGFLSERGYERIPGFQLRYIYFLDPSWRERLTVPEIPFDEIEERGATMYLGEPGRSSAEEGSLTPEEETTSV